MKAEGQRTVAVSDETLERLRSAVAYAKAPATIPAPEPAKFQAPEARVARASVPAVAGAALPDEPPVVVLPPGDKATRWAALREQVLNHPVCRAHVRPGKKVVLGVGSLDARIFFCGEAPGADEEIQGEPFVGPAGQLLTKMIQAMGLKREDVYIGNIMNWRPEMPVSGAGVQVGNRPPTPAEMSFCLPFLKAQLDIVQPQLIVALGATAAGGLLGAGTFRTLGEIKGRWHEFNGRPVMVTYHPSYILRNNSNRSKRGIWEDLLKVMERAGLPISERQRGHFLGK
ncbi:MAG TPA: uracil-DNA glycosylase family protein [Candidatus Limnocylindria bacterium]|nr:uracil-DNA glycosylase family protein [Candidatus Limnocylindria bacterium]